MTDVIRARGANAKMAFAFGASYDAPPASGAYFGLPFVSCALGGDRPLQPDDLLGNGREQFDPDDDVITADGDIVVPVDVRNFGFWLKTQFGAPVTANLDHAAGSWVFSAQPAANSTIEVNGTEFTFVVGTPDPGEIEIGADLGETIDNAVTALNGSADTDVDDATYSNVDDTTLLASHDTAGLAGNAFTLAASEDSHSEVSGATMDGGTVKHTFTSGAASLPAAFIEIQKTDISQFNMIRQIRGGKQTVALTRKGKLNATCSTIAKGENDATGASVCGALTTKPVLRFSQCFGNVSRDDVTLGGVVSASVGADNNLEAVEVIRDDSEIEDADAGEFMASGDIAVRLSDANKDIPTGAAHPCKLAFGWTVPNTNFVLAYTVPRAFLPKVKNTITGPGGIQKTYPWQSAKDPTAGYAMLVELVNDVANYNNAA